ncbi:polyprenyl diphosphate synthase [Candidatus Spongiihabitans sp.]|uniref:polyprenyl diphosphate synthase n=1 Tax=Candidatus Spongiihabitans sp. TaxID=3101308 RepID=UPI003C7058FB
MSAPDPVENYGNTPRHIAVIMDGNGRWAKQRGLPRVAGHRQGVEIIKSMVQTCGQRGIPYLTLFAFSRENWKRPSTEVTLLLELLASTLENELLGLHEHRIRLRIIGDLSRFPQRLQQAITDADELTRNNKALNLTIAINYGGKWDLLEACKSIVELVEQGEIPSASITPELIESQLCTHELPEPDFFIRTGGEQRISNFLLWQLAYTELYFTHIYWPDFNQACFDKALQTFANRQRRFGKTSAQIKQLE